MFNFTNRYDQVTLKSGHSWPATELIEDRLQHKDIFSHVYWAPFHCRLMNFPQSLQYFLATEPLVCYNFCCWSRWKTCSLIELCCMSHGQKTNRRLFEFRFILDTITSAFILSLCRQCNFDSVQSRVNNAYACFITECEHGERQLNKKEPKTLHFSVIQ